MVKLENFPVTDISQVPDHIRTMGCSALIIIKQDGRMTYGQTRAEKDNLIKILEDTDQVLFGWHGNYRTAIFAITPAELRKFYVLEGRPRHGATPEILALLHPAYPRPPIP